METPMKKRTWMVLSTFVIIAASLAIYLFKTAERAKRLAASPSERGWMLIEDKGCTSCHQADNNFRAPSLARLYGSKVTLQDGKTVTAEDSYIRESILTPNAKISAGYQATMPSFEGVLSDEEIADIIEALKQP
jgi:cytochrome c oxidase subunit 2